MKLKDDVTKYSHTENITDDGVSSGGYSYYW
jgi:hypothetical protein